MSDLLLQGHSRIRNESGTGDSAPMFRTGSGKSVTVKHSSIQKALSVIGDGDGEIAPMFRTGLGKSIAVKDSSVRNALDVIGDGNVGAVKAGAVEGSLVGKAAPVIGGGSDDGAPMFRTASGKSVEVNESSIRKALAVFGDESDGAGVVTMFRTGSGKAVAVKEHSMMKASSVLGGEISDRVLSFEDRMDQHATDQICSFSTSVLQTSCGRMVGVSSAGLVKAKTLLGLEENYKLCASQDTAGQSVSNKMIGMSNLQQMENGVCGSHRTASMHHTSN